MPPSILALPDGAILDHILSYSLPRHESQVWEWVGVLGQTCRAFRPIAQSFAPSRLTLAHFVDYQPIDTAGWSFDARVGILQTLQDFSWKRQHLKELHVDSFAVIHEDDKSHTMGIVNLIRVLIARRASFPELEWLDIQLREDDFMDAFYGCLIEDELMELVNAESFSYIPSAFPSLKKLCLCGCFDETWMGGSSNTVTQFFEDLQTPLVSLSLGYTTLITDDHVETFLPIVGNDLVRLELIRCTHQVVDDSQPLTDRSMSVIAQHCSKLRSFAIVNSSISSNGLERVLENNPGIVKLNLSTRSTNHQLGTRAVGIISRYLPRLRELRAHYSGDWFTDDNLIDLINVQANDSGGPGISLKLIEISHTYYRTVRGLDYAIDKGVRVIETNDEDLQSTFLPWGQM
mmetsp:Transcript_27281/g.65587  ORF Transcript_27281/g.65587 Transcript_27281/m.65587 type:complete len:403 (-) Transcript_27281:396-1604(-)